LVDRVHAKREVGRQHRRSVTLRWVVGVGDSPRACAVLRLPLVGGRRALGQLPLVAEQGLEEAVVPRHRGWRPDNLDTTGDRVGALAGAVGALPAEALLLVGGRLGMGGAVVGRARDVSLAAV